MRACILGVFSNLLPLERRAGIGPELREQCGSLELVESRKLGIVRCVVAEVAAAHVEHAASQPVLGFGAIFLRDAQREIP